MTGGFSDPSGRSHSADSFRIQRGERARSGAGADPRSEVLIAVIDTSPFIAPRNLNRTCPGPTIAFFNGGSAPDGIGSRVALVHAEMKLWSADEMMTHRTGSRVRSALASARGLGRRHVSLILYSLAVFGVPAAVIGFTGGAETVGFWIVSVVWMAAVVYGAVIAVFIVFLFLSPVLLVLDRVVPVETDSMVARGSRILVVGLAVGAFLAAAQLGDGSQVRLPVSPPNLGALLVMVSAAAVAYLLWTAAAAFKPEQRPTLHTRRHGVPEPDEEYWSNEYVVGWRAWNWDGSALRGVYAQWPSARFEATCSHCETVPSWHHVCGVYAAKRPEDVYVFYGGSPIVGRIEMWGDVIEHDNGYRASHARITALWVDDPRRAERIRAAYPGVNVVVGNLSLGQEVM